MIASGLVSLLMAKNCEHVGEKSVANADEDANAKC
jgi:hypothetical protein